MAGKGTRVWTLMKILMCFLCSCGSRQAEAKSLEKSFHWLPDWSKRLQDLIACGKEMCG